VNTDGISEQLQGNTKTEPKQNTGFLKFLILKQLREIFQLESVNLRKGISTEAQAGLCIARPTQKSLNTAAPS
jgi:hypothetical protein